jgi:hypothetical protein
MKNEMLVKNLKLPDNLLSLEEYHEDMQNGGYNRTA